MALIICSQCGQQISDKAIRCPKCGHPAGLPINITEPVHSQTHSKPQPQNKISTPSISDKEQSPKKKHTWIIVVIIAALLLLGGGVGGWFYYKNIYIPRKIDAEAPRFYSIAHILNLRSSMSSGADYNKLAELPYGTELITYDYGPEWSRVKVSVPDYNGIQQEGYVSSGFILNKHDFFWLNSIYGDSESRDVIGSAKCRIALLDYFKEHGYIGKISEGERLDAGISIIPNNSNQWQVFSKAKSAKYNTTYYKRIVNPNSKYTDFAVIIKNINTGERNLLYFTFDDDETPHFVSRIAAPREGYIKSISMNNIYHYLEVSYID